MNTPHHKHPIANIFFKGLIAILPLAITAALIIWLLEFLEKLFSPIVIAVIGHDLYFPGLGLLVGLILVFLFGLVINAWLVQKLYRWTDQLFNRIPLVKTLYSATKDLTSFFQSKKAEKEQQVVLVQLGEFRLVGMVTRRDFADLPEEMGGDNQVCVYVPMSYQLGGFTLITSKEHLTFLNISVEKAMRFVVTAGMKAKSE